jgi:hypothetical protein
LVASATFPIAAGVFLCVIGWQLVLHFLHDTNPPVFYDEIATLAALLFHLDLHLPLLENGKWKLEFCWWHHNQPPSEKEG